MLSKTDGAAPFLQIAQRSIKKPDNLQSVANHPVFRMHDKIACNDGHSRKEAVGKFE